MYEYPEGLYMGQLQPIKVVTSATINPAFIQYRSPENIKVDHALFIDFRVVG